MVTKPAKQKANDEKDKNPLRKDVEASSELMGKVKADIDLKAFDGLRQVAWPILSDSARRHLEAANLTFPVADLCADALARMFLERSSYEGDFVAFVDQAMKATVVEAHRRIGRLLVRELKAHESMVEASGAVLENATSFDGEGAFSAESLTVAWAGLPEGSRRILREIELEDLRYSIVSDGEGGIDSSGPPKVRRIRERLRELAWHCVERSRRVSTMVGSTHSESKSDAKDFGNRERKTAQEEFGVISGAH